MGHPGLSTAATLHKAQKSTKVSHYNATAVLASVFLFVTALGFNGRRPQDNGKLPAHGSVDQRRHRIWYSRRMAWIAHSNACGDSCGDR